MRAGGKERHQQYTKRIEKILDKDNRKIIMQSKFADVLEAIEQLPIDEWEMLIDILQNRLIENRREILKSEIEQSKREFQAGVCKPMSADEVMREVLS